MTRVFLLDDHAAVRAGLKDILELEGDIQVVGEAGTAGEAVSLIPSLRPDVAILDVRLRDGSGVAVSREVRSKLPELGSLMITSLSEDEALLAAVMAGAGGYVLKTIRSNGLVPSVRRVAAGESLVDPLGVARVMDRLRLGSGTGELSDGLSEEETRVLDLIADGRTDREIAADLDLADEVVQRYVASLLRKVGFSL